MALQTFFLIVAGMLAFTASRADVFEIPATISPDGKLFLTIEADTNENSDKSAIDGIGHLQIRSKATNRILATFEYSQYGPISGTSISGSVLWKADSRAFALNTHVTKSYSESAVYTLSDDKWLLVKVPDFKPKFNPTDGWIEAGKGYYVASSWVKDDILKMDFNEVIYRRDKDGNQEDMPAYWIYLRFLRGPQGPRLDYIKAEQQEPAHP